MSGRNKRRMSRGEKAVGEVRSRSVGVSDVNEKVRVNRERAK